MDINLVVKNWYKWLKFERLYSINTLESYMRDLNSLISFLILHINKEVTVEVLHNLTLPEIRSWLSFRHTKGMSARSNSRALSVVRNFFRYLSSNYGIENEAVFSISKPIRRKTLPKSLQISDIKTLIVDKIKLLSEDDTWIINRDIAIIMLLYGAGLRISEALDLKLCDVNHANLIIKGKGNKEREVFILPVVKNSIHEYVNSCPYFDVKKKEQYLFLGVRGKKLMRTYFANRLQKIREIFDLPKILSPHAFRHSFATHLLRRGVNTKSLQQLLGHSSLGTTQNYIHLDNQDIQNMHKNLQKRIKELSRKQN
ncbi:tyrosine-type recombinase/integrase [Wolbachia endosymbiont of Pentidionis agamae]|uniref:tyrosine-type recombinase/integrase n=1 Tax=Wolbachia endosymbiont of Pentidionis agamae TaxID=3110435 RepID=UPI002FD57CA7